MPPGTVSVNAAEASPGLGHHRGQSRARASPRPVQGSGITEASRQWSPSTLRILCKPEWTSPRAPRRRHFSACHQLHCVAASDLSHHVIGGRPKNGLAKAFSGKLTPNFRCSSRGLVGEPAGPGPGWSGRAPAGSCLDLSQGDMHCHDGTRATRGGRLPTDSDTDTGCDQAMLVR